MSFFNKHIWKSLPSAKPKGRQTHNKPGLQQVAYPPQHHVIRLHADGSVIAGLEIDDTLPGERDLTPFKHLSDKHGAIGNLKHSGGVHFITKAGKKWFIKFSEMSFVLNHRKVVDKPKEPVIKAA